MDNNVLHEETKAVRRCLAQRLRVTWFLIASAGDFTSVNNLYQAHNTAMDNQLLGVLRAEPRHTEAPRRELFRTVNCY